MTTTHIPTTTLRAVRERARHIWTEAHYDALAEAGVGRATRDVVGTTSVGPRALLPLRQPPPRMLVGAKEEE